MTERLDYDFLKKNHLVVSNGSKKLHVVFLAKDCIHIYSKACPKDLFELNEVVETKLLRLRVGKTLSAAFGDGMEINVDENLSFSLLKNGKSLFSPQLLGEKKSGKKGHSCVRFDISDDAKVYGLGDKMAPLNKRGYAYRSWNTDDPAHQDELFPSLYKSINYLLVKDKGQYFGLYFPSTYPYEYDLGKAVSTQVSVYSSKGFLDFYLFYGKTPKEITSHYSYLVGHPYFIRLKMLGNNQSRWSYENEQMVKDVFANYKKYDLPLDYIHLDIHYMDGYRDFTVDPKRFKDLKKLSDQLKRGDVELVAINDAGIKLDKKYDICSTIQKKSWAGKLQDGSNYVGKVWPGESIFPAYIQPECRTYFSAKAASFCKTYGISGIWNDMNEPHSFTGAIPDDVDFSFNGRTLSHEEYHNVYGESMDRCFHTVFTDENRRQYLLTRAAMATTSKYAFAWNGDNFSLWHHLALSIPQILSCSLSNLMFDGVDIGGFGGDCNKELLIRWCEGNILMPFFRNHSSLDTKSQEPYAFDEECVSVYRKYLNIRYAFVPYMYDLARKMALDGEMMVRPLFYNYPEDENASEINDEYMLGDDVLLAPILQQGQKARAVYLPKGTWIDYFTGEKLDGEKWHLKKMELDETGIFIRANTILPEFKDLLHLNKKRIKEIVFHIYGNKGEYTLYEDDGDSLNYKKGEYNIYEASFSRGKFTLEKTKAKYASPFERVTIVYGDKRVTLEMKEKIEYQF